MKVTNDMVEAAMVAKYDRAPRPSPLIADPAAFMDAVWEAEKVDMRRALEAVLPERMDRDAFAALLDAYVTAVLEHEDAAQWRDWGSYEHLGDRIVAARRAVMSAAGYGEATDDR